MYMNYKKLIAVTIALSVSVFTGSNVMAHGGGGAGTTSYVTAQNPANAH
jgi:hypothetical protein